ncbi:hypothetical protein [Paraburkholderia oxyphila]|uniref:hypothetical protein n=1 Tax=Paraburkholderia oxyphila TaxID=614212 RepID=UPI0012ED7240|nr:hypothetical protein [Paraburkholderia oxyphila]
MSKGRSFRGGINRIEADGVDALYREAGESSTAVVLPEGDPTRYFPRLSVESEALPADATMLDKGDFAGETPVEEIALAMDELVARNLIA